MKCKLFHENSIKCKLIMFSGCWMNATARRSFRFFFFFFGLLCFLWCESGLTDLRSLLEVLQYKIEQWSPLDKLHQGGVGVQSWQDEELIYRKYNIPQNTVNQEWSTFHTPTHSGFVTWLTIRWPRFNVCQCKSECLLNTTLYFTVYVRFSSHEPEARNVINKIQDWE